MKRLAPCQTLLRLDLTAQEKEDLIQYRKSR